MGVGGTVERSTIGFTMWKVRAKGIEEPWNSRREKVIKYGLNKGTSVFNFNQTGTIKIKGYEISPFQSIRFQICKPRKKMISQSVSQSCA